MNNVIEGGIDLGDLKGILQLQLSFENGNNEDNRVEIDKQGQTQSGKIETGLSLITAGRDVGNSSISFNADDLSSTVYQFDAEAQYDLGIINSILELNLRGIMRSINNDAGFISETEIKVFDTNSGNVINYNKEIATNKYTKNNDYGFRLSLRAKNKISIFNKVGLGFYPGYQIEIKKSDYDIETTKVVMTRVDNDIDGSFDINTESFFSGNVDNYAEKEINHTFSLPAGIEVFPIRALVLRFGIKLTYAILSRAIQRSETENYSQSIFIDNKNPSNNSTINYATMIDVDTVNTRENKFSAGISYGIGYKITENFHLDFLGRIQGRYIALGYLRLSLTYYFSDYEEPESGVTEMGKKRIPKPNAPKEDIELEEKANLNYLNDGEDYFNEGDYQQAIEILNKVSLDSKYYNKASENIKKAQEYISKAKAKTAEEQQKLTIIINPSSGRYKESILVEIEVKNMTVGKIHFAADGTDPDENSKSFAYKGTPLKIRIKKSRKFKFIAISEDGKKSDIIEANYDIAE